MSIASYIQAIPKVELNIHLEGAMHKPSLLVIADQNDIAESLKHFNDWVKLVNEPDYKRIYEIIKVTSSWLQYADDLKRLVYDLGTSLAKQNVRYAEVSVNPALYGDLNLTMENFFAALNDGRERAKRAWGVEMAWILSVPRDEPRRADDLARWISSPGAKRAGIVALGLEGREDVQPVGQFERAFRAAEKKDVPRVARAGDVLGAEGVLATLQELAPNRLIDAWGIVDSESALNDVRENQVAVSFSLQRALRQGWIAQIADHPVRRLYDDNVTVVLGTDMPSLYGTTLNNEYQMLVDHFGFSIDELQDVALNAVRASFLPDDEKQAMLESFSAEYSRLRDEHLTPTETA